MIAHTHIIVLTSCSEVLIDIADSKVVETIVTTVECTTITAFGNFAIAYSFFND